MIINHNIAALNTHRQLGANTGASSKNLEKLSSGLRINRAGDDAAGLAISEKMRGQIRGLDMAQKNAQDGISLIQTAEGALTETHSILQRMRELAVQSATDTNTDNDRANLQKEVDQLAQELTRIGKDTEFNTKKLLDGSFQGTFHIGANEGQNISLSIGDLRGLSLGVVGDTEVEVAQKQFINSDKSFDSYKGKELTVAADPSDSSKFVLLNAAGETVAKSDDGKAFKAVAKDTDLIEFDDELKVGSKVSINAAGNGATGVAAFDNQYLQAGDYSFVDVDSKLTIQDGNGNIVATQDTDAKTFKNADGETVLTLAADAKKGQKVHIGGTDISSASSASSAITTINTALETVSTERSKLGAYQNRLEHTVNNLGASSENLSAAESRIRDVDMAKEMVEFTKNNILTQAAQAMLAQANQQPQGVLQLLR
jgi:flagellin